MVIDAPDRGVVMKEFLTPDGYEHPRKGWSEHQQDAARQQGEPVQFNFDELQQPIGLRADKQQAKDVGGAADQRPKVVEGTFAQDAVLEVAIGPAFCIQTLRGGIRAIGLRVAIGPAFCIQGRYDYFERQHKSEERGTGQGQARQARAAVGCKNKSQRTADEKEPDALVFFG